MLCVPMLRVDMLHVAVLTPAVVAVKVPLFEQVSVVAPSAKLTEPVGEASPVTPVTVAVNVRAVPNSAGLVPVVSLTAIVGVALFTACGTAGAEGPAGR